MLSIVWTDTKHPLLGMNVIISPKQPSYCCATDMEILGHPHNEERWAWQVKRCRSCGFTVRKIVQEFPDQFLAKEVRERMTGGQMTRGPY